MLSRGGLSAFSSHLPVGEWVLCLPLLFRGKSFYHLHKDEFLFFVLGVWSSGSSYFNASRNGE